MSDNQTSTPTLPAMVTDIEVAEAMRVHVKAVQRLAREGRLPKPVRVAGKWRFLREEFERWMQAGCPDLRSST